MAVKSDRDKTLDTVEARRAACGYRIHERTCASCGYCARNFRAKGHVTQMIAADCTKHDFTVNLDRGVCNDFEDLTRRAKTITRRTK